MKARLILTAVAAAAFSLGAHAAEPDIKKGKKVFNKCKACHTVKKKKKKIGPHLVGIIGRPAGVVEGFKYSKAIKDKAAGDPPLVWTEENLDAFLKKPKKFLKGTKMAFAGLKKEKQRVNLIAYLKSVQAEAE